MESFRLLSFQPACSPATTVSAAIHFLLVKLSGKKTAVISLLWLDLSLFLHLSNSATEANTTPSLSLDSLTFVFVLVEREEIIFVCLHFLNYFLINLKHTILHKVVFFF